MKLSKEQLKQIIKEELSKVIQEDIGLDPKKATAEWKAYEGEIQDEEDLYMWLNEIGSAYGDYKRLADQLESEGIAELVADNNITFPITNLKIALQLYVLAKRATQ
jgi:5'-deoxynucleotidase YfbR-like HD superfamily hydrolase